ncbi:hypothetical protein O0L34_g12906 [Tuta absoluta]|nr:hypothetical protein O0L34_g12906 [Tuta absoluta]
MVKKENKISISEVEEESPIVNDNGKRPAESQNNDGKKRLKVKNLFRQPTVNELNRLQETETLFNSNLFRLQVEEILQEVKVKEKTEKKFQQWFTGFKTHLGAISTDDTEYDLSEQTLAKKLKVKLPIVEKLKKTKCVFKFHKFTNIEIVGSFASQCAINAKLRIDIQITVPAETYTKNDSINYRYHKKRSAYLAYIASHLMKLESIEELNYTLLNGCEAKPVLDIKPTGKLANHFTVQLNLTCESDAYKFHRFSPTRNNLREAWLFGGESQENSEIGPPTAYYNSTILSDLTAQSNQAFLHETLSNSENLRQAIVLLKIWLRQRNLQISGHVINMYVAYLVKLKRINNIMSSYQIVRNVWIALKSSELDTKGISLYKGDDSPPLADFLSQFPVVFLDTTGYFNLCWDVSKGTYDALKRECALAVEMLDNTTINSFIPLFMVPVKPLVQFDHIVRFKNLPTLIESITSRSPKESRLNYGIDQLSLVTSTLHSLLAKALGDRVELILEMVENEFSWGVKKSPEKAKEKDGFEEKLSIGFILNPENAFNVVLKGPPANLPEAEEFRAFWGDKSELRRFQDGAITETCVWEGDSMTEQKGVTRQIVDYLLKLKYEIPSSDLFHIYDQLDTLTCRKQYATYLEESSVEVLRAFDDLRRDLRGLTQLPLDISAVYGVSPVFSYCAPCPPLKRAVRKPWQRGLTSLVKDTGDGDITCVPEYTPVSKAIIELGHSGKWPGDIEAFCCLKAAFHMQIADRLHKQNSLATHAYPTHIDVLKNGLVFRLEIAHPKELTLLRREMENGVVKYRETAESVALQCRTVLMPRLRGALHGLHQKHPSFGPTVCLFKRWLTSHLLSPPHFPATAAELLAASVYVHSEPLSAPVSIVAGLLRVLRKLGDTDWNTEIIVLDFNEDMKREEISEIEQKFSISRDSLPPMCIVTAYDGTLLSAWTQTAPTDTVVLRAQVLAKAAAEYLENNLAKENDNVLAMFVPSLAGYDALIHLQESCVPYTSERVNVKPVVKDLPEELTDDVIPVVEFDPVARYLDELRSAYDDFALFFHDSFGGDVIAVLWKPDINEPKEFVLTNMNALTPHTVKGEMKYKVNTAAIIEDFRIMGKGLVKDITVCT